MKEEEQRIAIAEACGWEFKTSSSPYGDITHAVKPGCGPNNVPDYLHDLNTMHEAEKVLPKTRQGYYNAELFLLSSKRNLSSAIKEPTFIFQTLHATAAQRAEAFLRTIGKWRESAPTNPLASH